MISKEFQEVENQVKSMINFILGCEDLFSYKKWGGGVSEKYNLNPFINLSFDVNKLFISIEHSKNSNFNYGFYFQFNFNRLYRFFS